MVLAAPHEVIAPGEPGPVYWTHFPAAAVQADWRDPNEAHRAVMRLFPRTLPGDQDRRRADAGILFRVEPSPAGLSVLVQSCVPPETIPVGGESMSVHPRNWKPAGGETIVLRVAVNPTIRGRNAQGRETVKGFVAPDQMAEWLNGKFKGSLTGLTVLTHARDSYAMRGKGRGRRLVIDIVDVLATVANSDVFDEVRRAGVGRSKAYGCGLVTASRAVAVEADEIVAE